MILESFGIGEAVPTLRAYFRFFSSMNSHVNLQSTVTLQTTYIELLLPF